MRKLNGQLLAAAHDLERFLGCSHATWLDLRSLEEPIEEAEEDPQSAFLKEKGLEHEREYLAKLRREGLSISEIPPELPFAVAAERTGEAMAEGVDIIFQAALADGGLHGYADFLRRTDAKTDLGDYGYEAWDTKLARSPSADHIIQLCVYSELLAAVQGSPPRSMHLVLGDGRERSFRFEDFTFYYGIARDRLESFLSKPPADLYPQPCRHCELCRWRGHCTTRWAEDDHLTLVANIRRSQIMKLTNARVETVRSLARLGKEGRIPGLSDDTLNQLRSQAQLQIHKRDTGEDKIEILPASDGRGFARLPMPDPRDLFIDFEGDPLYPDGLEYLLGLYYHEEGRPLFRVFWAHDHAEERRSFERLMDLLVKHLRRYPNARVYHYNHYEETAMKRLASRYGTRESLLDDLLRGRKLVDLYKVVREGLRISEPGYSLKNLEIFYMGERTGEVKTAGESMVVYQRWQRTQDPGLLDRIADYNQADCLSARQLRQWLLKLRPDNIPWFMGEAEELDEKRIRQQQEAESLRISLEDRLQDEGLAESDRVRELISHLLEFHRREMKPEWWAMFDRRDRTEEELIEDPECLGGLRYDRYAPPSVDGRSTVYSFKFPPQEFKFSRGDRCLVAADLEQAGVIVSLGEEGQKVQIKRSNRLGGLPAAFSLIPGTQISHNVLKIAIFRFAIAAIDRRSGYTAVRSLLAKELPRIKGLAAGEAILDPDADVLGGALKAVANMQDSYLFIQGPPGSGKTYCASHIIVELIKAGKKLGVASNSHKAINNLLTAIEEQQRQYREGAEPLFRGIKKSTAGRPDSFFEGKFVTNFTDNKDIDLSADLIAGTAWLFAREELDQKLDYLFVDEAGQVSLANLLAMGLSTRNIVLIGDQMQLAQPIKGVHPGESGQSVLEYLLQGESTITPDRGIFLPTTWRMHEDVCRFISDVVYEGRLEPRPENQNQRLILNEGAHTALSPTGIRFVPVDHTGCSQKSVEEAEVVKGIYESLLRQQYQDREGNVHAIQESGILVVSPYNMQVNHLQSILPAGARVGTVDKFQGQQAEAVLISMTTSSGEDLPRNIEFLYSKNRLNVAISRARSLAVILASPKLLEIPCQTVEQMRLVNTLCRASSTASITGST